MAADGAAAGSKENTMTMQTSVKTTTDDRFGLVRSTTPLPRYAVWSWRGRRWTAAAAFVRLDDALAFRQRHGGIVLGVAESPPSWSP
jgi:hypothetical protein